MRTRRPKPHDNDEDAWLITYADMVTLLLCFFIIMFALSAPNPQKVSEVAKALEQFEQAQKQTAPEEDVNEPLKEKIEMSLGASGYDKFIAVSKNDKFISMEVASSSFFQPGSAEFAPAAMPMLDLVVKQLMPLKDKKIALEIEGHTDDSPISSAKYPSNWELSTARASSVVRYFIAQGFPKEKIHAVGYAETKPKAPNEDAAGHPIPVNQELNRRVVIKLLKADEDAH